MATTSYSAQADELAEVFASIGWRYRNQHFEVSAQRDDSGGYLVTVQTRRDAPAPLGGSSPLHEAMALQAQQIADLHQQLDAAAAALDAAQRTIEEERKRAAADLDELHERHTAQLDQAAERTNVIVAQEREAARQAVIDEVNALAEQQPDRG